MRVISVPCFGQPLAIPLLACALAAVAGCQKPVEGQTAVASPPAQSAGETPAKPAPVEFAELGKVQPFYRVGDLYLAGQPSQRDVTVWANAGIKTVVNLCKPDEIDWNEGRIVRVAKMNYIALPFGTPEELTDEIVDEARRLLRDDSRRPLALHCASANRVGAVWMAYRVLDEGVQPYKARAEAVKVGMRSPGYSRFIDDYIERHQEAKRRE